MCTCFHSLRILQILNQDGLSVKIEKKVSVPKFRKTFIVSIRNNKGLADFSRVQCGKIVFKVSRVLVRHFHMHSIEQGFVGGPQRNPCLNYPVIF